MSEGWGWPLLATKEHYFRDARSLCGRWWFTGHGDMTRLPMFNPELYCKKCMEKRAKELKKVR